MFENLRTMWVETSERGKVGLIAGVIVILILLGVFTYWVMRSDYQVLFSDLDPKDASTIVAELDKMKVPYKLGENGTTILVDKDIVHTTRLKLMGKGLNLHGAVGFEIFNNTDFGMTEFAQKINYQRALQGELARTIMGFDEVKFARVHLVLPESGLLKKNNVKPKASISLVMKDDAHLQPEQVLGIQRLVAASVPEIDPASVTIIDQKGVALTRNNDSENESDISNARLDTKKQIEAYFTKKVVAVLDKAFGPGQGIVSVDVTLNNDHVKITREDVLPLATRDGEALGVTVRKRHTSQTAATIAAPATVTDAKEVQRPAASTTSEVEYQTGRKVEQIVSTPGNIKRISVGVLLPRNLEPSRLDEIRDVIAMATGLNPARGDAIALSSLDQFAAPSSPATIPEAAKQAPTRESAPKQVERVVPANPIAKLLIYGLLIAALVALLAMAFYRQRVSYRRRVAPLTQAEREAMLAELLQWLHPQDKDLRKT